MGLFSTLGGIAGTIIGGPGVGTMIGGGLGGLLDKKVSGGGGGGGGAVSGLPIQTPGIGQFLRLARAAQPTAADFSSQAAMRGLGRDAAGRIGALQAGQAGLEAGSQALRSYESYQRGLTGLQMQAQMQQRALGFQASQARKERGFSFLNNVLGIGAGLIGTNLGEGRGPFDFTGGGGMTPEEAVAADRTTRASQFANQFDYGSIGMNFRPRYP